MLLLLISMMLPWISAWDHPLHTPDEGRYGSVSAGMVEHGEWLVPHFRGVPHLTKPPLAYWLQALSIEVLGRSEFALRLPSLVAGSLACLVIFLLVRRLRGEAMAGIAVALYGVMPLPFTFNRLATIDALLNFFWIAALAGAALAIDARRRGDRGALWWLAAAWIAVAFGALEKGPIAPAPMVIVAAWLALARRWSELRWFVLHGLWGAALALAPIGAWVAVIAQRYPESWEVWREQFIQRFASGLPAQPLVGADGAPVTAPTPIEQDDIEPLWFYLPIFLIGMLPATCALTLPWFNMRLREAMRAFTLGDLRSLMLMAALGPLIFFSIAKGKMPAYIVPVAMPIAVLVAGMLARAGGWRRAHAEQPLADRPVEIEKEPDVRLTFALVMAFGFVGAVIAGGIMGGASGAIDVLPFVIVPVVAGAAVWRWKQGERGRREAMMLQWLAMVLVLVLMLRLEHRTLVDRDMGSSAMVDRVKRATGSEHPQFVVYDFRNPTIDYYSDADPLMLWSVSDLQGVWRKLRPDHAILIPAPIWRSIEHEHPDLAAALVPLASEGDGDADDRSASIWNRWPGKPTMVLRMIRDPEEDRSRMGDANAPERRN